MSPRTARRPEVAAGMTDSNDLRSRRSRASRLRIPLLVAFLALLTGLAGCVPAYEARLRSLRERGDLDGADRLLARAQDRSPEDAVITRERGILAFERGKMDEAIPPLERAMSLDSKDGRAALYLAAASDRNGKWSEASIRYRRAEMIWQASPEFEARHPEFAAALSCQRQMVDARRITELVESRLEAERTSSAPPKGQRILFLPFAPGGSDAALSLRLGLAALLSADWERAPAAEPVPFVELVAFLRALDSPLDGRIGPELRTRLARLTGARYVVDGRLTELNDVVTVAPVLIDLAAGAEGDPKEQRLEYQESRVGTILDLEKTLLFRVTGVFGVELTPGQQSALGQFTAKSGLAVLLYGEAMRLIDAGKTSQAAERLDQAVSLDPGFRAAREARLSIDHCQTSAGDTQTLISLYESARRADEDVDLRRQLLSQTTQEAGRIGGPEGEGENLSINRPLGAGSVSVPISLPR